jgi:predicted alpha/beta-hydrolase family hydrolase
MTALELATPHGTARAHLRPAQAPWAALLLGHGAGGGIGAPDLLAATEAALARGVSVALVEQPYRVAGRRSAAPAHQLDAAWIAVAEQLRDGPLEGLALLAGGRSAGARVACRTAGAIGAIGVLCLAFPLHPPARAGAERKTRLPELEAAGVPVLVVQGRNDRFGMPPAGPERTVAVVRGDHGLKSDETGLIAAVGEWLSRLSGRSG